MSLYGIMLGSACNNCHHQPPSGTNWPIRHDDHWYCCRDCLVGLHPELIHDGL